MKLISRQYLDTDIQYLDIDPLNTLVSDKDPSTGQPFHEETLPPHPMRIPMGAALRACGEGTPPPMGSGSLTDRR
jgi:hypothetical protein